MNNKKGQESGTLQNLIIAALVIGAIAVLSMSYISSIGYSYNVTVNNSRYEVFNKFNETNTLLNDMAAPIIGSGAGSSADTDIISQIVSAAYSTIKLFSSIPEIYSNLVKAAIESMGIPSGVSSVLIGLSGAFIIAMILFAAIALIMKVRA
jgi:hypothetical protein